MKLLLDECLPLDFRRSFPEYETHTAQWAGLKGKKNGELLKSAEAAGYDVLLTVDHGLTFQQNLTARKISIICIRSTTNKLEDLALFRNAVLDAWNTVGPGEVVYIG